MKQTLTTPEQESNIDIKIGDMFRWTNMCNMGRKFIYLGDKKCFEIPFERSGVIDMWTLSLEIIKEKINNHQIERLPKGTTFTITQE